MREGEQAAPVSPRWATISAPGGRRDNEDRAGETATPTGHAFVVADGLGGHAAGELAAQVCVAAVCEALRAEAAPTPEALRAAFEAGQRAVHEAQARDPAAIGCRTTAVVLVLAGDRALWGHLGDSRLYLFRGGRVIHQTLDHSVPQALVQTGAIRPSEIRRHPDRNRLLRSLGGEGEAEAELLEAPLALQPGDAFLLCSDGFWELVSEAEMEDALGAAKDPADWLRRLESRLLAQASGEFDNYTATAVFPAPRAAAPRGAGGRGPGPRLRGRSRRRHRLPELPPRIAGPPAGRRRACARAAGRRRGPGVSGRPPATLVARHALLAARRLMAQSQYSLQPGTRIGDYEILTELGAGSFGITYKAWDHRLQTYVALKEYLPLEFAVREADSATVAPRSEKVTHQFQFGLKGFLEEARTIAQFRDARIVRVTNFMEANGTAYLVMDYEEGESLDGLLRREQRRLEEPEVLRFMIPVLEGLCIVHRAGVLHRDVKPANIYLRAQGSPLLLDFGAARHALGEETQNLTSIVTPGYGPFEQYQRTGKQGPWTDVYGAGATLYRLVTGRRPAEAPDRAGAVHAGEKDPNPPAQEAAKGRYTQRLLETIDWMLQPLPQDRPQRVEDALERIASTEAPTLRDPSGPPTSSGSRARATLAAMEQERASRRQWVTTLAVGLAVLLAVAGLGLLATRRSGAPAAPEAGAPQASPALAGAPPAAAPGAEAAAGDAAAGDPAAAAAAAREQQIAEALTQAEQAVAELRLTTPESDSAMFHYQQVLSLDPENASAREGVRNIVLRYVSLSDSAAASGNRSQAATYLERAASISPNDPEVIAARARLAAAPAVPRDARGPRGGSPRDASDAALHALQPGEGGLPRAPDQRRRVRPPRRGAEAPPRRGAAARQGRLRLPRDHQGPVRRDRPRDQAAVRE